jgi:hypothetical protein
MKREKHLIFPNRKSSSGILLILRGNQVKGDSYVLSM